VLLRRGLTTLSNLSFLLVLSTTLAYTSIPYMNPPAMMLEMRQTSCMCLDPPVNASLWQRPMRSHVGDSTSCVFTDLAQVTMQASVHT
jgi:hypothetical protein